MDTNSKIIALDIETTGLDPKADKILSISIAVADSVEDMLNEKYIMHRFAINPKNYENIPGKEELIKRLYGDKYKSWTDIYNACMEQGYTSVETEEELAEAIKTYTSNPYGKILPIIGQYVRFDLGFIDALFDTYGKRMYNRVEIDTRELFYQWKLKTLPLSEINSGGNLEKIIEELKIPYVENANWHFSDYDTIMTIKVFSRLWNLLYKPEDTLIIPNKDL